MASGIWRGTVQRVNADGTCVVRVTRLGGRHSYGPCATVEFPAAAPLLVGDQVVVALAEGDPDRPVVIGRLAAG